MIRFWKTIRLVIRWILVGSILIFSGLGIFVIILTGVGSLVGGYGIIDEIRETGRPKYRYNPVTGRMERIK